MRIAIVVAFVVSAFNGVACDPGIYIRVENDSSRDVCVYDSAKWAAAGVCTAAVPPGGHDDYGYICTSNQTGSLFLVAGGVRIYGKTATCGAWKKAGAVVTVTEDAAGLHASDRFSDAASK